MISTYFFESNYGPISDLSNFETKVPIDFIPYYFILGFLFMQRVIRKPVIKFHSFAAKAKLLLITTISFCNKNSIIL
jgi:hypothetical protein